MPAKAPRPGQASEPAVPAALLARLGDAVSAVGTQRFDAVLLAAIESGVPVDTMAAVTFHPEQGMRTLGVASRNNLASVRSMTRDYVARHYAMDPNFKDLVRRRRTVLVRRHDAQRLQSRAYRGRFFSRSGAVDKVAFIWWANELGFYVNLYRLDPNPGFTEAEVALLRALAPVVASLFAAHGRRRQLAAALHAGQPEAVAEAIVSSLGARLSMRERAVLCRILIGLRTEGVALDLGIKPTTVITLRKRAYAKLGIATQAELFALCLRCLPA